MRPRKNFLYFLTDSAGKSYYVDGYDKQGDPIVRTQSIARFLKKSPKGWQEQSIMFSRSAKFFGSNRSFTVPLTFVKDGADIIRTRFYGKKSYEEKIYLIILKWNHLTDEYESYYKGELDLTEIDDDPNESVTVNLVEGGLHKILKSNENTTLEIPCDGSLPEHFLINFPGIIVNDTFNYIYGDTNPGIDISSAQPYLTVPFVFSANEGDNVGIVRNENVNLEAVASAGLAAFRTTSQNYLLYSINSLEVDISGTIVLTDQDSGVLTIDILLYTSLGNRVDLRTNETISQSFTVPSSLDFLGSISLAADERLFLMIQVKSAATGFGYLNCSMFDSTLSLSFKSRYPESQAWAMTMKDLFKLGVQKIGNNQYLAESALLDEFTNIAVTCGDALRVNTFNTPFFKVTITDIFNAVNCLLNAALGITKRTTAPYDEYIFIESKQTVYDSSVVTLALNEVSDFKVNVAQDQLFSDFKIGYANKEYEERAGKLEFNTTAQWRLPVTTVSKSSDLICPFRADVTGIEKLRAQHLNQETTDGKGDNDTFIIIKEKTAQADGTYNLLQEAYDSITGLVDDDTAETYYNIEVASTKRMFERHGPSLRSIMPFLNQELVKFQSMDKNKELSTTLDGVTITDKADVRVDQLGDPLFYHYIFTFKTKVPINFIDIMTNAVNGHVSFTFNGRQFWGFPLEVSVKPALNDSQTWKLLASPRNNIASLINLDPDPTNNLDMATYGLSIPMLSPVQFVPIGVTMQEQYHFKHMDSDWFIEQINRYSARNNYFQKWQSNDVIELQAFTNGLAPVQVDIISCKGRNYGTIAMSQVTTAAVTSPYALFQASINLANYSLPEDDVYYLIMTAGTGETIAQFISEGLHVRADWPDTLLFEYSNDRNKHSTIFTEGYEPSFRVEGTILFDNADADTTSYEDEPGDIETLDGIPFRRFILKIGDGSDIGVPPYMIDKLNRIMILSDISIDGKGYSRDKESKLEYTPIPGRASKFYSMAIREAQNRDSVTLTVDGELQQNIFAFYNIQTKLFGDFNGQAGSSTIQVEALDQ